MGDEKKKKTSRGGKGENRCTGATYGCLQSYYFVIAILSEVKKKSDGKKLLVSIERHVPFSKSYIS